MVNFAEKNLIFEQSSIKRQKSGFLRRPIVRFLNGFLPIIAHSDTLFRVFNQPL